VVGVTGQTDPAVVAAKAQIQMLADEIAVLRTIPAGDPRRVSADRVVAVKAATIRSLRAVLPGIPTCAADDAPTGVRAVSGDGRCRR
jgi:hypothetical protein